MFLEFYFLSVRIFLSGQLKKLQQIFWIYKGEIWWQAFHIQLYKGPRQIPGSHSLSCVLWNRGSINQEEGDKMFWHLGPVCTPVHLPGVSSFSNKGNALRSQGAWLQAPSMKQVQQNPKKCTEAIRMVINGGLIMESPCSDFLFNLQGKI